MAKKARDHEEWTIAVGAVQKVPLGGPRVLLVQAIGGYCRLTMAKREPRVMTDALILGGSMLVPLTDLRDVAKAIQQAARDQAKAARRAARARATTDQRGGDDE
jgi:hypothetical protein